MEGTTKDNLIEVVTDTASLSTGRGIKVSKGLMQCVPSLQGRLTVVLAYVLFTYMYALTVTYGIWNFKLEQKEYTDRQVVWAIVNTVVFTFFFVMMMASHLMCVI